MPHCTYSLCSCGPNCTCTGNCTNCVDDSILCTKHTVCGRNAICKFMIVVCPFCEGYIFILFGAKVQSRLYVVCQCSRHIPPLRTGDFVCFLSVCLSVTFLCLTFSTKHTLLGFSNMYMYSKCKLCDSVYVCANVIIVHRLPAGRRKVPNSARNSRTKRTNFTRSRKRRSNR